MNIDPLIKFLENYPQSIFFRTIDSRELASTYMSYIFVRVADFLQQEIQFLAIQQFLAMKKYRKLRDPEAATGGVKKSCS